LKKAIYFFKKTLFVRRWKKRNTENRTYPGTLFNEKVVSVGKYTYGQLNVRKYGSSKIHLKIGSFCSIADDTFFLLDGEHSINHISTYPMKQDVLHKELESISKGDIIIDDDVWIGFRSTILSGVHVGQGAIIAAGSVVTKDIPPYAVVGGVPAKLIKYRFNQVLIEELLQVDYSKLTKDEIEKHIDNFYTELYEKKQLSWLPKK
jgi:virginiamycin A acetyltransferase